MVRAVLRETGALLRDLPARFRLDTRLPARQPAETSNSSGDDRSRGSAEKENDMPEDPSREGWYNEDSFHPYKKYKIQQQQSVIRMLNTLDLNSKQPAACSSTSRYTHDQVLKMRSDVVGAMKKIMTMHTFFPSSTHYDLVALSVMGKPDLEQAKDDYPNYLDITRRAETAARNFRADTAKRVTEEAYEQWKGEEMPFDVLGEYQATYAKQMLAGDVFRKGGVDDYFGNEEYRKICYVSNSAMDDRQGDGLDEYHNEIKFMTAPMLAFVEIKVRSLLSGQKSLPANDSTLSVYAKPHPVVLHRNSQPSNSRDGSARQATGSPWFSNSKSVHLRSLRVKINRLQSLPLRRTCHGRRAGREAAR
ncbi:hypothetical protein WJX77_005315 [Trebouxia sp. C0004]